MKHKRLQLQVRIQVNGVIIIVGIVFIVVVVFVALLFVIGAFRVGNIKFVQLFSPYFDQSVKCPTTVFEVFVRCLRMIFRPFITTLEKSTINSNDDIKQMKNINKRQIKMENIHQSDRYLTLALVSDTIHSMWSFFHNRFAFVGAPTPLHSFQFF